jgi:hypothetical protein
MMQISEFISQMVPLIVPFVGTTAIVTALPFVPKIGFGRACMLAVRSKFIKPPIPSQRKKDVDELRKHINNENIPLGFYLAVLGQNGIGKTCAIKTALQRTLGVCFMYSEVRPKMSADYIVSQGLASITNITSDYVNKKHCAKRVLWWYRLLFRRRPILVIPTDELLFDHRELSPAARSLSEYGICVIIDATDNATNMGERAITYEMEPMSDELISTFPQLRDLFEFLKKSNLYD